MVVVAEPLKYNREKNHRAAGLAAGRDLQDLPSKLFHKEGLLAKPDQVTHGLLS